MAACPYVGKSVDSRSGGGDKACKGGGRVHHHFEGGGGKSDLLPEGKEVASDVELGTLFFFGFMTKMARRLLWTPYIAT